MFLLTIKPASFVPFALKTFSPYIILKPKIPNYSNGDIKRDFNAGAGTPDRSTYFKFRFRYVLDAITKIPKRAYIVSEFGKVRFDLADGIRPSRIWFSQHNITPSKGNPLIFRSDVDLSSGVPVIYNSEQLHLSSNKSVAGIWGDVDISKIPDITEMFLFHYNMYASHANKAYTQFRNDYEGYPGINN